MFQLNVVQKIRTRILRAVIFFFPKIVPSKNMVEPERPQMTIWRRIACWIRKATRAQLHARPSAHSPKHTHKRTPTYAPTCTSKNTAWPLNMGQTGCPETSVTRNLHCVTSKHPVQKTNCSYFSVKEELTTKLYYVTNRDVTVGHVNGCRLDHRSSLHGRNTKIIQAST
jgi:hypothetical protein